MTVADDFRSFCGTLSVTNRSTIGDRYGLITRRLNLEFWDSDSKILHSFYTGSYGRRTAIGGASDVDMIMQLPYDTYTKYDGYVGNGQSALLQAVRTAIKKTYSVTNVGADGQVVQVPFDDGVMFEVVPAFVNKDDSYTFPDSNAGGSWKTTNPKPEFAEIASMDAKCNGNLKWLCKIARAWKKKWDVPIGGLLIDTLAYQFIRDWEYRDKSFMYYDWMSRDFFGFLAGQDGKKKYWLSPGAGQYVWRRGNFEYKATRCRNIAIDAIDHAGNDRPYSSRKCWREIFGTGFPR